MGINLESLMTASRWLLEPEDTSVSYKPQLWHLEKEKGKQPRLRHCAKSILCFVTAIGIGFLVAKLQ